MQSDIWIQLVESMICKTAVSFGCCVAEVNGIFVFVGRDRCNISTKLKVWFLICILIVIMGRQNIVDSLR